MGRLLEHPASLLVLILVIVILLGYKRLPDVARNLGRSSRILKSEVNEMRDEKKSSSSVIVTTPVDQVTPIDSPDDLETVKASSSRVHDSSRKVGRFTGEVKNGLDAFKDGMKDSSSK